MAKLAFKFGMKDEEDEEQLDLEPVPAKCLPLLNEVARHQMNISDAYFSMACYVKEAKEAKDTPLSIFFIQDQAHVKWFQAKQTLKYIAARKSRICVPDIQRPVFDNWGAGTRGLVSVLEMEKELTKVLENLSTLASETEDCHLLKFAKAHLIKQKRNEDYLAREIPYQERAREKQLAQLAGKVLEALEALEVKQAQQEFLNRLPQCFPKRHLW